MYINTFVLIFVMLWTEQFLHSNYYIITYIPMCVYIIHIFISTWIHCHKLYKINLISSTEVFVSTSNQCCIYVCYMLSICIWWYTLRFSSKTNKWNLVITCDGLAVFVVAKIVVHKCYFISNILFALPFETSLTFYMYVFFYATLFCCLSLLIHCENIQ